MTLSEYITAEFGLIPDEVQLEQIRRLVSGEMAQKIIKQGDISFLARTSDKRQYAPFRQILDDIELVDKDSVTKPEPLPKYCKVKNKEYCFLHNQCQECTDDKDF